MSMHFAPQWVKPIKPTGSALGTSSGEAPLAQAPKAAAAPASPFPALGQPRSVSPTTAASSNRPLSYSRVTHTPASPSFSGDGYFPYAGDGQNGGADPSPHPFRYSRDQILAIWDEEKFKERPIELMQMAETDNGAVLVSKAIVNPVGLRELSDTEKRIMSTSVHPPMATRRQQPQQTHTNSAHGNIGGDSTSLPRRVPQPTIKETGNTNTASAPRGASAFGGFGRGEGGAFGGSKYTSGALDGERRQPGAIGGGFGGVGKRTTTRREDDPNRPSAAATWRPVRNQSQSSATFEGVLGFGNSAASSPIDPPANGRQDGSDRGWGAAEKQWRAAPNDPQPLSIPSIEPSTQSVIATASATPIGERDAQLRESTPGPRSGTQTPQAQEPQDLGVINWYYRDPNGQEQGPFTGNQMHDWYSHSYFQDDLPVRRESETSFHTLSELKANTGNAVQPFLTAVRPRLPPNLPIPLATLQASGAAPGGAPSPGGMNDSFSRLNIGSLPAPQPQYHPNAYQGGHFGQPQFNAAPFGGQQWNPAPGAQSPARLNGAYGSIGPQSSYSPYSPAIGTPPIQRPDVFGAPVGQPSPWQSPAAVSPAAAAWQQQPQHMHQQMAPASMAPQHQYQQQPQQQQQGASHQYTAPDASYFPPTEEAQPSQAPAEPTPEAPAYDEAHEESMIDDDLYVESDGEAVEQEESHVPEEVVEKEEDIVIDQQDEAKEVEEEVPAPKAAPASVWAKATPAPSTPRKPSSEPTPAQASKLPPPHASLPPKPTTAPVKTEAPKEPSPPPAPTTPVAATPSAPKPAPWATSDKHAHGPSLREIQEAEARQAAARKQARAEARAAASPATIIPTSEDLPASMSWGLPTSKGASAPPTSSTPPTPAWGGGSDGPKKTLKQIQEEEERRNQKLARQQAATVVASPVVKRGYADLAASAHPAPTPAQAAAAAAAGWTTVGAGGKASSAPAKATPVVKAAPAAVTPAPKPAAKAAPIADEQPSIEFIRWTKQALTGLTAPVDDFISMLLSFPVDPPASSRAEVQEIIADSVYASSSTLDGRRFAQEFMTRRKADAKRDTSKPVPKIGSLADVVKTQPKAPSADLGFKVVKAKKKRS